MARSDDEKELERLLRKSAAIQLYSAQLAEKRQRLEARIAELRKPKGPVRGGLSGKAVRKRS